MRRHRIRANQKSSVAGARQPAAIRVHRVHDPMPPDAGACFLVDRLWPRGVKKEALRLDGWLKDVAPSDALRRWFGHDPAKWAEFRRRYFAELDRRPEVVQPILDALARGPVTLLFSARERRYNNAVVLAEYLQRRVQPRGRKGT